MQDKLKTLTIIIGNARGGEKTWESMYKNLLEPYNSDLALCFGVQQNKEISLYTKAKYVWEVEEYENWRDYYSKVCNGFWEKSFLLGKRDGLAGGIDDCIGSGSIIFAFRHIIKNKYKDILLKYDRIILTRSDFYYNQPHPILSNDHFWIVDGEDHYGIGDRHHIFPSTSLDDALGIVEYMDSENGYKQILNHNELRNPETLLKLYFQNIGIFDKIKRFPRVNYTVATRTDTTRWAKGVMQDPNNPELWIKYPNEYASSMSNRFKNKIFNNL